MATQRPQTLLTIAGGDLRSGRIHSQAPTNPGLFFGAKDVSSW
jgi:hypothetical protein